MGSASTPPSSARPKGVRHVLPYVRWTESQWTPGGRQRAYIAIQNVGATPAGAVTVRHVDKNGDVVGTHSLPAIPSGGKVNSWAGLPEVTGNRAALNEFGYAGGQFGGSVIVEGPAGSQLVAVARVASAARPIWLVKTTTGRRS